MPTFRAEASSPTRSFEANKKVGISIYLEEHNSRFLNGIYWWTRLRCEYVVVIWADLEAPRKGVGVN